MKAAISQWIIGLDLQPHPEGGYYRETYRSTGHHSDEQKSDFPAGRNYSTAIYYLLRQGDFSAFHRIQSDELWHFYDGGGLNVHIIDPEGGYRMLALGCASPSERQPQGLVPAGCWFASEVVQGGAYALAGCTVAPGFDFRDFELADCVALRRAFPQHGKLIERLTR